MTRFGHDAARQYCGRPGLMTQFGSEQGFYGQGNYSAHQASYSHHERYVCRLSDAEGHHHDAGGHYFHLMLVNVLHGNPLKTTKVWMPSNGTGFRFGAVQDKLGQQFDSVKGGPHRPTLSGGTRQGWVAATTV